MIIDDLIASARWKAFRLASSAILGPRRAETFLARSMIRDMDEALSFPSIADHLLCRVRLSEAYVQEYCFPDSFPDSFCRKTAFDEKNVYLLRDVFVSPKHAVIWLSEMRPLQQSFANIPFFFAFGGALECLIPSSRRRCDELVCPMPTTKSYYHLLYESVLPVLQGLSAFPDAKILLHPSEKSDIQAILSFFGISNNQFVFAERPLRVARCILVPRWANSGYTRQSDLDFFRNAIAERLPKTPACNKVYVSRSKCTNRPLANERELEALLSAEGFIICHFENMTFADQMNTIHSARIVVAPHGAGIANMIAARKQAKLVEIISPDWFVTCYARLAVQLELDYHYVEVEITQNGRREIPLNQVIKLATS